jgi:hypothetical protein
MGEDRMDMHHVKALHMLTHPASQGMRVLEGFTPLTGEEDGRHPLIYKRMPQLDR